MTRLDGDEGIPDTEYVAQLARHLASVPAARQDFSKRGAVSIVIRLVAPASASATDEVSEAPPPFPTPPTSTSPAAMQQALTQYLQDPLVVNARAQILFIQRAQYPGDPWSGHIGFPGGKQEAGDGTLRRTAERETWEELGVAPGGLVCLGRLDDTQAAGVFGRVLIVVSPWVFLQVASQDLVLSNEVASAHWVDLRQLLQPRMLSGHFASLRALRGAPGWSRAAVRLLGLHEMLYPVAVLRYEERHAVHRGDSKVYGPFAAQGELRLWGISLVMAATLVDWCRPACASQDNTAMSLTGPWPKLHHVAWADFNLAMRMANKVLWRNPRWRSPRRPLAPGYFTVFQSAARVAFPLACALKAWALYVLAKRMAGGLGFIYTM
ncbi:hypothetical protein GGI15_002715 [Coemansia interrupta]|uniref:Nudix hydrolase domain-containing protein n=1 Tax=Coemansia interrupta TaxID=1126814 RepID=A0A9W8LKU1_9FUNG|nr:hypothetical protein GGI15_002715 [Coemansia interrupta]